MKNIFKIFVSDIRGLTRNFFALVIAVGICFLPSLYAWFNIYSNWDPYANTSSIKIAVSSEDKDYTLEDGTTQNMGDEVLDELKENDSIGWVFTDSEDALDGVYSGKYYAAVVIGADFTSGMYNVVSEGFKSPSITYYENEKKNAIATKITDTAVSTLQTSINKKFIEVVASTIFTQTNELSTDLKNSKDIGDFEQKLKDINGNLQNYNTMIDDFIAGNQNLSGSVSAANDDIPGLSKKITQAATDMNSTNASLSATEVTLSNFNTSVQNSLNQIQSSMNKIAEDINNAGLGNKAKLTAESISQTKTDAETLQTQLTELASSLAAAKGEEYGITTNPADVVDAVDAAAEAATQAKDQAATDAADAADELKDAAENAASGAGITLPDVNLGENSTDLSNITLPSDTQVSEETKQQIQSAIDTVTTLQGGVTDILTAIQNVQSATGDAADAANGMAAAGTAGASAIAGNLKNAIDTDVSGIATTLTSCKQSIESMRGVYSNNLVPEMSNVLENMSQALTNVTNLLNDLNSTLGNMGVVFEGVESTVTGVNDSLTQIQSVIASVSGKLTEITDKMDAAGDNEKIQALLELLDGNPEVYGEYFSQPVTVNTEEVYPIANYGSAVTPFYTVLALWVGALILVSIVKVKAEPKNLVNAKSYQLFFGRYLLFFVLGQVQTLITVLGDIYLLHCQVLYPGLFYFAAALTSFTFTLLIYALTISFGDIGKALAVVIVVIQIAGSGGTYPIEILPDFYQKVYIFFPFPYAINALRETIGGMYGSTFETCLAELLIFAVVALLIGLVIRIPFVRINHFMEKRMEDTKMM